MDDALLDVILGRIDGDTALSEGATDILLAACQGDDALSAAVGGDPPPRPVQREVDDLSRTEPVGAYLASITAEGFRGVARAQTLRLHPGPGLTVVVGRNGSGKSTFAEALEVLLTGSAARFQRHQVFKDGWRNLHQRSPVRIAAELHLDASPGVTTVERTWGDDASLAGGTCTVQVSGEAVTGLDRLGWSDDLTIYRPFLAHSELEAMLDSPSGLYDRLASVLGLEDLTAAQDRLRDHGRTLDASAKAAEAERRELVSILAGFDDERAPRVHDLLAMPSPDLDAVARLVTGADPAPGGVLDVLRRLTNLAGPDLVEIDHAATRLRAAADAVDAIAGSEAARAKALADLLDRAVRLHRRHPDDTDCPVCGRGDAIDSAWQENATAEVTRLRAEADAAERALADAKAAVNAAMRLLQGQPPAVTDVPGLAVDTAALAAIWTAWTAAPPCTPDEPGDVRRLADHLETAVALADAVEVVRQQAGEELAARDDRWAPVAKQVAAWLDRGRAAADVAPVVQQVKAAESWLKAAHDDIRNDRLRPIARRAQETWQSLRHESNVDLGPIRLSGDKNRRRVVVHATVDGADGNALGIMSQGEVNALALSIFLPRATLPDSPFRFVVIDDPVQAMDPAKVEGLARVLDHVAQTRQVVVFTHDDRLPTAIRLLGLPANLVQVQRAPGSVVDIVPAGDPVSQALDEARALANSNIPASVRQRVVPGLCRLALEAAFADATRRRLLRFGMAHAAVEAALGQARTVNQKATLALYGNLADGDKVLPRLNRLGKAHADTFQALKKGAHGELIGQPHATVTATEKLIDALRQVKS